MGEAVKVDDCEREGEREGELDGELDAVPDGDGDTLDVLDGDVDGVPVCVTDAPVENDGVPETDVVAVIDAVTELVGVKEGVTELVGVFERELVGDGDDVVGGLREALALAPDESVAVALGVALGDGCTTAWT